MNDDSHDPLIQELCALRPAAPPARLRTALEEALPVTPAVARWPRRARGSLLLAWSVAAAAACFAGFSWWQGPTFADHPPGAAIAPAAPAESAVVGGTVPVASSKVLFATEDEGIVLLPDGVPARQMRYRFVDTVRLRADATGASIAVSYPREEIRFVPINLY